jgi:hypothetical protein
VQTKVNQRKLPRRKYSDDGLKLGEHGRYQFVRGSLDVLDQLTRHCQSKFVYFATTSEPDFVAIDFPAFFRVDLSGSMAAPSI